MYRTVHPHACGEHKKPKDIAKFQRGSSPRLWGTRFRRNWVPPAHRFIPTPVGNTLSDSSGMPPPDRFIPTPVGNTRALIRRRRRGSVHPHACGEHFDLPGQRVDRLGSSPRLWGTPNWPSPTDYLNRFIPTPVGNT
ncbi:hypothetical protein D1AOALGA4SA_11460 [Olavius algarvensis Delta 1 endosymbiont]|nr:hypothetical protein D1AOALGA4SA_11460 [Olavius algarvensis Delta 1 endosymbiont]